MDKEDVIYYSALKKKEIMPFCSYMDGPRDYHTKQSKKEKDNTILYHSCVESKI